MRCTACSRDDEPERTFRSCCETIVGRFAVDQKTALACDRMLVCFLRAETAEFFVGCKQHSDVVEPLRPQTLGGSDLRSDDALRIARAAAVDVFAVFARFDKWRHGVHVS